MVFDAAVVPTEDWTRVGALLRDQGYTTDAFRSLAGVSDPVEQIIANTGRYSFFYLDRVARDGAPLSVLLRLFLLCARVPAAEFAGLGAQHVQLLRSTGIVVAAPENPALVHSTVAITEVQGRHFLSDPLFENRPGGFVVHDTVERCMPPHASSLELLGVIRRPPGARSFLDIGCGSGCQSVLFARDYERVVGFDPLERPVRFARANAQLNDFSATYLRDGWETFAPGEQFDHIVFNPPPPITFPFINSGLGKLLAPGGRAHVWALCERGESDRDWTDHVVRRLREPEQWELDVQVHEGSPFAVPQRNVREQRMPTGTLLVDHPSKAPAYLRELAERRVVEVASLTITLERRCTGGATRPDTTG